MQLRDLTMTEADYLQTVCNFTQDENQLFLLRLSGLSHEECAEKMHRSLDSIKQLSRKVNAKIERER